jgi:hypothetical protein
VSLIACNDQYRKAMTGAPFITKQKDSKWLAFVEFSAMALIFLADHQHLVPRALHQPAAPDPRHWEAARFS